MPILKKINSRQVEHDLRFERWMETSKLFLTEEDLNVDWEHFRRQVMDEVIERLKSHEEKIDEKLKLMSTEESVSYRLSRKAQSTDYGSLFKEIADFRIKLGPLIERGWML